VVLSHSNLICTISQGMHPCSQARQYYSNSQRVTHLSLPIRPPLPDCSANVATRHLYKMSKPALRSLLPVPPPLRAQTRLRPTGFCIFRPPDTRIRDACWSSLMAVSDSQHRFFR
jgi:hypothetical protein